MEERETLILDALIERESIIPEKPLRNRFLMLLRKKVKEIDPDKELERQLVSMLIEKAVDETKEE